MKENNLLNDLSRKLIHLSGNDFINKKLSGHGKGRIFNVCDEIPQFVLNRLQSGKKFKIKGHYHQFITAVKISKLSQAVEEHDTI